MAERTRPVTVDGTESDAWLTETARPGAGPVGLATVLRVIATALTCGQWAGAAGFAGSLLSGGLASDLLPGLCVLLVAGAASAAAGWAAGIAERAASERMARAARRRLLVALLPSDAPGEQEPAAAAETLLGRIDQVTDHLAHEAPLRRSAPGSMIIVFVLTAIVHWPAAIVLALATLMLPANMWLAGMLARDGNDRYLNALDRLGAIVLDSFRGIATLRRLRAVDRRSHTIDAASEQLQRANLAVLQRAFVSGAVMDVVVTMSIAVSATYIGMTLLGYVTVPGTAHLDLAAGLFVLLLCPLYFTPMRQAAAGFHAKERASATARAIVEIERAGTAPFPGGAREGSDGVRPVASAVRVVIDGVELRDGAGHLLVRTAGAIVAPAGGWTAIVGPSGAGKSTLLQAVSGMRRPDAGIARWEEPGADDGSARSRAPIVGAATWIGQSTVLLPGSLADNLRIGAPKASEPAMLDALEAVGLRPLVQRLPQSLLTPCGVGGYAFSAGEARRIAIARAMLRGSRLWLLDEPTAHLDEDTERTVLDALRAATAGCTVVVVTHSAQVVAGASVIVEVRGGIASQLHDAGRGATDRRGAR